MTSTLTSLPDGLADQLQGHRRAASGSIGSSAVGFVSPQTILRASNAVPISIARYTKVVQAVTVMWLTVGAVLALAVNARGQGVFYCARQKYTDPNNGFTAMCTSSYNPVNYVVYWGPGTLAGSYGLIAQDGHLIMEFGVPSGGAAGSASDAGNPHNYYCTGDCLPDLDGSGSGMGVIEDDTAGTAAVGAVSYPANGGGQITWSQTDFILTAPFLGCGPKVNNGNVPMRFFFNGGSLPNPAADPNKTEESDANTGCPPQGPMASYFIHLMLASLHIQDTPISYNSPRGPATIFKVSYNQREANQPSPFPFCNLGPKWTFNWLSYVTDDPANSAANATVYVRGGGTETYSGFNSGTQSYAADPQSMAVLVRTSSTSYEKRFPDGSKEVFTVTDGSTSYPRRVFMTSVVDAAGNATAISYDTSFRITTITDSLGQALTLDYGLTGDPLKVTSVTDPFGRSATFDYTSGQLTKITDPVGIQSQFTYAAGTDFINAMTTPYGTTTFAMGESGNSQRWLEATDPLGGKERVEYNNSVTTIPWSEQTAPSGVYNEALDTQNTYYWNKKAMADAPGDYTKAHVYHWLLTPDGKVSGIKHSEKHPLENRVWYAYSGQPDGGTVGTSALPLTVSRILDDGTTQQSQYQYNSLGNLTQEIDPVGRTFSYVYASNNIDVLEKHQTRGTNNDLLASFTYNSRHLPLTATDAADETTTYTYNSYGQVLTATDPKNETTTYAYDRDQDNDGLTDGYLTSITRPATGAVTTFTYDTAERVQIVTDSDGYAVMTSYDNIDRPVTITYPDTTTRQFSYNDNVTGAMLLDVTGIKDRRGRWTYKYYNGNRKITKVTDPLGRNTLFDWCMCGALNSITDGNSHVTTFGRDVEGRVTSKTFADTKSISYTYESTTSRLKSFTDAKSQVTNYLYYRDNDLKQISYTNAQMATPTVTFTYDVNYNRIATMADGTGTTTYSYNAITGSVSPGAGRLQSVAGPLANSTVAYTYDELGRELSESVNGVAANQTYDSLGRVATAANPLGSFTNSYVAASNRLQTVALPNGQLVTYNYFSNAADKQLQTIQNTATGGTIISKFDYLYDAEGEITSLTRQLGSSGFPMVWSNGANPMNDAADQLTNVTEQQSADQFVAFAWNYDNAGNRTSDNGRTYTINNVNEITNSGYTYDNNGNLTADPSRTYEWDAANRLTAINYTAIGGRTEFTYDGLGRRVEIAEKNPGMTMTVQPANTQYSSFTSSSFTLSAGTYTLTIQGLNPNGGDNTMFMDAVKLNGTLVPNGGFETPGVGSGYTYNPTGASWSFVSSSGVTGNNSGFTSSNPAAPEGTQVGFIQGTGYATQSLTLANGSYTLSFYAAQRGNWQSSYQQVQVSLLAGAAIASTKNFVWIGSHIAEERDGSNTVVRRFYTQGEQISGTSYYYTRDHLGSIRELTDSTATVHARYDYDPYGYRTKLSGDLDAEYGYTGHYYHQSSGLNLTLYRSYDASVGRWISRDPIGEIGGGNLYNFVSNNPIQLIDPSGLLTSVWVRYPAGLVPTGIPYVLALDAGHILMDVNGHRLDYTPTNTGNDFLEPNQRTNLNEFVRIDVPLTPAQEIIAMQQIDELKAQNLPWDMNGGRYCSIAVADVLNQTGFTEDPINGTSPMSVANALTGRGGNDDPRFNPLTLVELIHNLFDF